MLLPEMSLALVAANAIWWELRQPVGARPEGVEHDVVLVVPAGPVEGAAAGNQHQPWAAGSGEQVARQLVLAVPPAACIT